jgi:hypothetical protein
MKTNYLIIFLGIIGFLISCNSKSPEITNDSAISENESTPIKEELKYYQETETAVSDSVMPETVKNFVKALSHGAKLDTFMSEDWLFIYHNDNRCNGSTDGKLANLMPQQIDETMKLNVKNDGDAWACDKKAPSTYEMEFLLKSYTKSWDRFEIAPYSKIEEKIFYILGSGESDYLKIYYDDKFMITQLEYRSEDPG